MAANQFTAASMPGFWELSGEAQRGIGLPPFPSSTFNGHATLATGCWPEHHGLVGNGFLDPGRGAIRFAGTAEFLLREPLWVAATRNGLATAVYHWPCATGAWQGVTPWRLEAFSPGIPDRAALAFSERALGDGGRLVMAYLSGTDPEGHRYGPDSDRVREKLAALDAEVAPWVARMLDTYEGLRILLVADHGMARMERCVDLRALLGQPATVFAQGGSALVALPASLTPAAKERLAASGLQVWRPEELPEAFHLRGSARLGSLVVQAPLGTWFTDADTPQGREEERLRRQGAHGYDASEPLMHAWLMVLGTGRRDPLPPTPLWDLAPTVAQWLGISWARKPDGVPLVALGNSRRRIA